MKKSISSRVVDAFERVSRMVLETVFLHGLWGPFTLEKSMADDFSDVPLPSNTGIVNQLKAEKRFMKMVVASLLGIGDG